MKNTTTHPGFVIVSASLAAAASFAGLAHAGVANGNVFQMDRRGEVVAEFLNSDAGATGSLYFVGHQGANDLNVTHAVSSDPFNLGAFLFTNHGTPSGASVALGQFDAGDTLYFAYVITNGSGGAPTGSLAHNDLLGDVDFFKTLSATAQNDGSMRSVIGVEDIFNRSGSDWDYNDMSFALRVSSVPTPGAGLLAAMGGAVACRRKRREPVKA